MFNSAHVGFLLNDSRLDFRSKSRRVDVVMHDDACGRPGDRIERGLPVEY